MYEDEQDYDISKAGETTFTVPLNISVYPYTEYTTRNLVITKGDSKLKQISVSVKDNDEAVSRRIAANDYGEYVAVIPEENTSEYVTVSLNAPSDGYVLELYRQGTKLATGVADEDTGSFERRIDLYNVENLNNARNELTIYVSDGQGNEALYPLWLNKVSSNTAVKTVIAQRGTSEESVAGNNTDTSSNCDSHEVEITDSAQTVKLYIEAEDPTATVKVGTKSRVGSIEISVPVSTGRSSYDVDFDIISTATDENGIAISQAHKVTLVRQSDVAELESVVVNDTNVVASGTSYNAHNLTSETANVVLKAKNNGRIEVIDRLENVLASDDTTSDSVWTDSDMPLENGETTKYVVRVTSQSGRKSVDYMLVLERADYVGGLEFLKTKLADEDDYTTLTADSKGIYTLQIDQDDETIDIWTKALASNAEVTMTLPTLIGGNVDYMTVPTSGMSEFNTETDWSRDVYLRKDIKEFYIPVYVAVPNSKYSYRYTLKLERQNLNIGEVKVYAEDMDNELAVATTDKNGNDVYELIVSEDKTNVHVKVTASGNNAMVSGDYASVGAALPNSAVNNSVFEKEEWALNGEVTTFEFKIRAEDADENTYNTIYLNVYKANEDTDLEKVEVRYTRNNVEGTVQAVKGENGEYNAWISSDKTSDVLVDLIAQAANAGAMVQIDGNTVASRHTDVLEDVSAPVTAKKITVVSSNGQAKAEYKVNVYIANLELKTVDASGNSYYPTTVSESIDGRAADVYEIFIDGNYTDIRIEASDVNAELTTGILPDTAPEPNATSSNSYYNSSLALKDGYAEIQVNVGNANIPSSFNNISYVRIYKKDDNNNLDYIDLTYEDAKGDEIVVRAEKVDDDTYAAIVDENVSLTDIKAKAESNSAKVQIEPNTTYKTSYDEYKEYQLTSDEQNVNINVKPSSGTNDKTYTLTIYRANTSLESVKVDGTEEIGNVKKEVINGSTADVYEATVTTDKADLYVKAVSDSALVNVSANGTKAEDTASNIWTISGYEIIDNFNQTIK